MKARLHERYSLERIPTTQFEQRTLFWSDDFDEVTVASESGYRMATLAELQKDMYQPLRPNEAFKVQEGLYAPVCVWSNAAFSKWEYVKIA